MEQYTTEELLAEIVKRCGSHDAPKNRTFIRPRMEVVLGCHGAVLYFEKESIEGLTNGE